ncbi:MAG: hypothetical protein WCQ99_11710 [Pseudomonadota bacterium]
MTEMQKQKLIDILKGLLETDDSLDFLLVLKREELERLVSLVRARVEK